MTNRITVAPVTLEPEVPIQETPESIAEELEFTATIRSPRGAEGRTHHDPDLWHALIWALDHSRAGDSIQIA